MIAGPLSRSPDALMRNAPSKIARVLAHLLSGTSINRFEAERIGDHCLPSTIAVLANTHCLTFQRQQERVPNNWGAPCTVTRYSLPESEHRRARLVLHMLCRKSRRAAV
ncbi:hypothetical protein DBO86_25535 [Pseudomonas indoloxydans]|uniref:Helix-turn-helix domain-containing protein n=1 Tax=Ectopseudomonas oleovorans TaxID=301 RepID=A0A2T5PCZ8_ECTOL|nr:hypothetical protein [Pseudomonas indoloxydans]PTU75603.1 hypothetical protein DBO86_25535 [Pseudomonas indoloxydans]